MLRAQPCALAAAAAMALACALYYAGSGPAQPAPPPPPPPASPPAPPAPEGKAKAGEELLLRGAGGAAGEAGEAELHVLAVLAKAERNEALLAKAAAALRSLVRFGKLGPREALALHLLCDGPSRTPARQLLHQALRPAAFKYKVGAPPPSPFPPRPRGCVPSVGQAGACEPGRGSFSRAREWTRLAAFGRGCPSASHIPWGASFSFSSRPPAGLSPCFSPLLLVVYFN